MSSSSNSAEPRFLADVMLGTLAKWLRILGYDAAYDNGIEDDQLVERCRREGRIALTRDLRLTRRRRLEDFILISSDDLVVQIAEVLEHLGLELDPHRLFSRCIACNTALADISRSRARSRVPQYVYETQQQFRQCPGCGRVYWPGTHRDQVLERLASLRQNNAPGSV